MADDLLMRLRKTTTQSIGYFGHQELSVADLQIEAANEIEQLRIELASLADKVGAAGKAGLFENWEPAYMRAMKLAHPLQPVKKIPLAD